MHWIEAFNAAGVPDAERQSMLDCHLGAIGEGAVVRSPFYCDFGSNIYLANHCFLNFHCTILDVESVTVGEFTAIGPGVQILTSDHPRDPELRRRQVRYGRPVVIGANVWIGGGALILPGVTIGDDAIIGAGSVVTKDVAVGATVVGSPARVQPSKQVSAPGTN